VLIVALGVAHSLAWRFLGLAGPILGVVEPYSTALFTLGIVWFATRLIALVAAPVC
jgi:hypothetical protein